MRTVEAKERATLECEGRVSDDPRDPSGRPIVVGRMESSDTVYILSGTTYTFVAAADVPALIEHLRAALPE